MIDQRPIKPDQKYIQAYIEKISQVEKKQYLKRKQQPTLPCHKQFIEQNQVKEVKMNNKKTKAEIYQQIKQKNRKRFGQKKLDVEEVQIKKIDPKKMTVNYKPKNSKPIIDTSQYKLKKQKSPQSKSSQRIQGKQDKIEYDKLLDYFQKQLSQFQKQKQEFNKVAGKLKFKQAISQEQGLSYAKVRKQVENSLIAQKLSIASSQMDKNSIAGKPQEYEASKLKTIRQCNKVPTKNIKPLSKTFSIGQIRSCMEDTSQQLQKIKEKMLNRQLFLQEHRYDIPEINLLPQFDAQSIYDYIDHKKLKHSGNDLYNKAISIFNSKFQRQNQERLDNILENSQNKNTLKKEIKVKYVGDKRVMKYEGWTEVWIPAKQRLMTNNQGYKVVWLANGDVLQEFPNSIKTYYCKNKQIVKIEFKAEPAVYYYQPTHQIWQINKNKVRQTIHSNGARQITYPKDNDY